MPGRARSLRHNPLVWGGTIAVAALVLTAGFLLYRTSISGGAGGCRGGDPLHPRVLDETAVLRSTFAPGGIQTIGSNGSEILFAGVGPYERVGGGYQTVPALESWSRGAGTERNLTSLIAPYFPQGGLYPVVWNGTDWLVGGQKNTTGVSAASLVFLNGSRVVDRSGQVAPYFRQGWIWTAAWNGSGWLVAGNDSSGATAVYLQGSRITDLTPLLSHNRPRDWIQWVGWNGSGWLLGGGGILATFEGGSMTDLLPGSPFASGGVYAAGWNGTRWLIGGTPDSVAVVSGRSVLPGPVFSTSGGWINNILPVPGGWLASGGTVVGGTSVRPQFDILTDRSPLGWTDASGLLPASFSGGWVQFGAEVTLSPVPILLLGGVGGSNPVQGPGYGALAEVTWSCS